MFGYKSYPDAYTTPGNPKKSHGGGYKVLDDGTVYASCSCGWSATARGEVHTEPQTLLEAHVSATTRRN